MSIFDVFKSKPQTPNNLIATYTLASHYKGFKAFAMVVFGNQYAMKNNKTLNSVDLQGKPIYFQKYPDHVRVFIDNLWVGSLFDKDDINDLATGKITAVYAQNVIDTVVGKNAVEKRARIRLYVKYGD